MNLRTGPTSGPDRRPPHVGMVERLRNKRQCFRPPAPIEAGLAVATDASGRIFRVPYRRLFDTHASIIGPTGFGKTFLAFSLAAQIIRDGHGIVILDPDGGLYRQVLSFLLQSDVDRNRIVLINANHPGYAPRLNPLQEYACGRSLGVDIACSGLLSVAQQQSFEAMPQLRTNIRAAVEALLQNKLPLAVLPWLLGCNPISRNVRDKAVEGVANVHQQLIWSELNSLPLRELYEHLKSANNRCGAFAADCRMTDLMCSPADNVDWFDVLQDQKIVLVNCGLDSTDPLSADDTRLMLSLCVNGVINAGHRQPIDSGRHTIVLCDEFATYADENMAAAVARLRKKGTHFCLMHQAVDQVRLKNPELWSVIDSSCKIKIAFGGASREDAERFARTMFTGAVDGEQVKHRQYTKAFEPKLVWLDVRGRSVGGATSHSTGTSLAVSSGESESHSNSSAHGRGQSSSWLYTAEGGIIPIEENAFSETTSSQTQTTASSSYTRSRSRTYSSSESTSSSTNWSESVVRVPFSDAQAFWQEPSVQFFSLEEQWEKKVSQLMNLPQRCLVAKVFEEPAMVLRTMDVLTFASTEEEITAFETSLLESSPWVAKRSLARRSFHALLEAMGFSYTIVPPQDVDLDQYDECVIRETVREAVLRKRGAEPDAAADEPTDDIIEGEFSPAIAGTRLQLPNCAEPDTWGAPRRRKRRGSSSY